MQIGQIVAQPGERAHGWLPVADMAGGLRVAIPVFVLRGTKEGPMVALVGAVHGDEYEGTAAIWKLCAEIDPIGLSGTIVGVPIANPPAFQAARRTSPLDDVNLARVFPGNRGGTVSERIAFTLMESIIDHCDAVLDLHSGGNILDLLPMVMRSDAEGLNAKLQVICRATRLPVVSHASYKGTLMAAVLARNIPAVTFEVGGGGRLKVETLEMTKNAVVGVLRELEVLPGRTDGQVDQIDVEGEFMKSTVGGFFVASVGVGARVGEGQRLGEIHDAFGEMIAEVSSPHAGLVCAIRATPPTQPGDQLGFVGRLRA